MSVVACTLADTSGYRCPSEPWTCWVATSSPPTTLCLNKCMHTRMNTRTHVHTHARTHTHTHTHMHIRIHANAHVRAHKTAWPRVSIKLPAETTHCKLGNFCACFSSWICSRLESNSLVFDCSSMLCAGYFWRFHVHCEKRESFQTAKVSPQNHALA